MQHITQGQQKSRIIEDETHCHSHGGETHAHSHNHELFSEVYSRKESQLLNAPLDITDIEKVTDAKRKLDESEDFENLMNYGNALCFQLRYCEAREIFKRAAEKNKEDSSARRKVALCCLKTGLLDEALREYSYCDSKMPNNLDIVYRIGLAEYYKGNYEQAKKEFFRCFLLSIDNGEMYIAVIYWYILSCVKIKEDLSYVLSLYNDKIQCGHHIGYDLTAKLFCGLDSDENLYNFAKENDEMTFVIFLYGLYCFYQMKNEPSKALKCKKELRKTDKYWASFSYLGAFYDFQREDTNDFKRIF